MKAIKVVGGILLACRTLSIGIILDPMKIMTPSLPHEPLLPHCILQNSGMKIPTAHTTVISVIALDTLKTDVS